MTKINLLTALVVYVLFILFGHVFAAPVSAAPSLLFNPTTVSTTQNQNIQVTVRINTDGQAATSAKATIRYSTDALQFVSATNGDFFTDFNAPNDAANGQVEMSGLFQTLYQSKTGQGTLGTVTFQVKVGSGSIPLSFSCSNTNSSGTFIIDTSSNANNILNCTNTNSMTVTVSGGTNPTSTPTSTPTNGPTNTPAPTATNAPQQHQNAPPNCTGITVVPSTGYAQLWTTVTCTGNDSDDDINYAEFSFGNGVTQSVTKNIGANGSISIQYGFPKSGNFTVSCRMRDNNQLFSGSCTTPVVVKSGVTTTTTTTTTTSTSTTVWKPATRATATPTPTKTLASPTPIPVALVTYIPPQPSLPTYPTIAPPQQTQAFDWTRIIVGGLVILFSLILGLFLIQKARQNIPPKPSDLPPPLTS
jgi:hypothetical protein